MFGYQWWGDKSGLVTMKHTPCFEGDRWGRLKIVDDDESWWWKWTNYCKNVEKVHVSPTLSDICSSHLQDLYSQNVLFLEPEFDISHTHTFFCFLYFRLAFVKVMIAVHHWLWPCHVLPPFTISSYNVRWFKLCTIFALHFFRRIRISHQTRPISFLLDPACVFLSRDTSPS